MNINHVVSLKHVKLPDYMKDFIEIKRFIDIINLVKNLLLPGFFVGMKEVTLQRTPMNVNTVVQSLHRRVIFKCVKEFTLRRNPMNGSNVAKPLHILVL